MFYRYAVFSLFVGDLNKPLRLIVFFLSSLQLPSITVSVKEDEWIKTSSWVYENFDSISGISFLPFSEHTYKQAPYQDCSQEEYESALKEMPKNVNWSKLAEYEEQDYTVASQELACSAGVCEVVDIPSA